MLRKIGCLLEQKIHCQFKFLDFLGFILIDTMQLPDLEMIKNLLLKKKNHFFSRIHVKDIAQTLYLSLNKSLNNDIYNLSDDKPASNIEVVKYACNLINFELPKIISFDELEEGMLKDFYKDSKKVSNKKIKDIFKLKLIYPTYEEGLKVNV